MVNTYVMFCFIDGIGGGQNYVDSKVKWLKDQGWNVVIFAPKASIKKEIPWTSLKEYKNNSSFALRYAPEVWSSQYIEKTLKWMEGKIGKDFQKIIIESHTDYFGEWGERLAQRLNAKHICFLLDECLEKYEAKEYLYFKYSRREIAGIHNTSMQRLFDGYKKVPINNRYVLTASHNESVKDISCDIIDNLASCNWNIAYVGRSKQYEKNIIEDISKFSLKYPQKSIHFIVLGEVKDSSLLKKCENVKITKLGFMTPIPRCFFAHVDVVIAGAGCATISALEKVPTIVADASTCKSGGILGYSTSDVIFSTGKQTGFDEELENVLVRNVCKDLPFKLSKLKEVDNDFKEHFRFINDSEQTKEYFNFNIRPQNIKKKTRSEKIRYILGYYLPDLFDLVRNTKRFLRSNKLLF